MLCWFLLDNHFLTVPDDNAAIAVGYELTAEVVGGICGSDGLDLHLLDTSDVALLAKHGIITAINNTAIIEYIFFISVTFRF